MDFIRKEMSSSDIICLQEFWLDDSYASIFRAALEDDYDFHTVKRTGGKADGVAVLLRRGKFDVRSKLGLSLSSVGDRVALIMHLRSLVGGEGGGDAVGEDMILVNTHLAFPHNALDRVNQMSQIEAVTDTVERAVREAGLPTMTPRVVVGDLNVEETDPVCRHLGKNGFRSAFASLHREQRVITHRNHRGEEVSNANIVGIIRRAWSSVLLYFLPRFFLETSEHVVEDERCDLVVFFCVVVEASCVQIDREARQQRRKLYSSARFLTSSSIGPPATATGFLS